MIHFTRGSFRSPPRSEILNERLPPLSFKTREGGKRNGKRRRRRRRKKNEVRFDGEQAPAATPQLQAKLCSLPLLEPSRNAFKVYRIYSEGLRRGRKKRRKQSERCCKFHLHRPLVYHCKIKQRERKKNGSRFRIVSFKKKRGVLKVNFSRDVRQD